MLDLPHSLTSYRAQYPNNRRSYLSRQFLCVPCAASALVTTTSSGIFYNPKKFKYTCATRVQTCMTFTCFL